MKYGTTILLLVLAALLQTACSNQAVYTGESFASDSPFRMRADGQGPMACESARRALLGQGYLIESASGDSIKGRKAYRTEDTQNTFIEMNIVCLDEVSGSTLFATGVLSTYALKKSSSSASVGLSALGSISLPIGQSADSLVKVSEETIDDKDFYKRFFSAVDIILGEMRASSEAAVPAMPEPVPPPAATPAPVSLQAASARALEPAPALVAPAATQDPVPAPSAPEAALEPFPTRAMPATAPPPNAVTVSPAVVAEPAAAPAEPEDTLEPFPVTQAHTNAPLPPPDTSPVTPVAETSQAAPPVSTGPDPTPAQDMPAMVLEEFAAPRSEPFR